MKCYNAYTRELTESPDSAGVKATRVGGAYFGDKSLIYSVGLHKEFVPYSDIAWAFVYDQSAGTSVLGIRFSIGVKYLMLISHDAQTAYISMIKGADNALEELKKHVPDAEYGYSDELQTRFFGEIPAGISDETI